MGVKLTDQPQYRIAPKQSQVKMIIGVLHLASKYRYGLTSRGVPLYLFAPYDETLPEFIVGCSARDTTRNLIIGVIPMDNDTKPHTHAKPRAQIQKIFGPVGKYIPELHGLLEHYCPTPAFKHPVDIPTTLPGDEARQEISAATGWIVFHVDPAGCRDVDDALAYHPESGRWATTIADVAALVEEGSPLDMTAAAIGATFYDSNGHVIRPMLPPSVSEEVGSLLPGQRRRGLTLLDGQFVPTWITVAHGFSYEEFPTSDVASQLGLPPTLDAHEFVAEAMLEYNRAAAAALKAIGRGILRTQAEADATAAAKWGASLRFLAMEAAEYEVVDVSREQRHCGLDGLYCHATSPLRRYVDIINQRVLKGTGAPATCPEQLNARATANRRWSRDVYFLENVMPGVVQTVLATWMGDNRVWIPEWRRIIRLRHEEERTVGEAASIQVFCDPTRRNWKQRILTARV